MENVQMKNNKRKLSQYVLKIIRSKKTCDNKNILSVFINKDILRIVAAFSFPCGRYNAQYQLPPNWIMDIRKFYRMISPEHLLECAASQGKFSLIKWFHQNESKHFSKNVMIAAAAAGHLDILIWLHENRSEGCDEMALNYAAGSGHFGVVKWLWENRTEGIVVQAVEWADKSRNCEISHWLRWNRTKKS